MIEWQTLVQDLFEGSVLRWLLFSRRRWYLLAAALLLLLILSLAGGWLIAEVGPLVVGILVAGLIYMVWMLADLEIAYLGVIGVITLLPFGSLPFSIGFTPYLPRSGVAWAFRCLGSYVPAG